MILSGIFSWLIGNHFLFAGFYILNGSKISRSLYVKLSICYHLLNCLQSFIKIQSLDWLLWCLCCWKKLIWLTGMYIVLSSVTKLSVHHQDFYFLNQTPSFSLLQKWKWISVAFPFTSLAQRPRKWLRLKNSAANKERAALWSMTLPFIFPDHIWGFMISWE